MSPNLKPALLGIAIVLAIAALVLLTSFNCVSYAR